MKSTYSIGDVGTFSSEDVGTFSSGVMAQHVSYPINKVDRMDILNPNINISVDRRCFDEIRNSSIYFPFPWFYGKIEIPSDNKCSILQKIKFSNINEGWTKYFGWNLVEIENKYITEIIEIDKEFAEYLEKKTYYENKYSFNIGEVKCKNGKVKDVEWVFYVYNSISEHQISTLHIYGFGQDITEYNNLKLMTAKLNHELRNLFSCLLAYSDREQIMELVKILTTPDNRETEDREDREDREIDSSLSSGCSDMDDIILPDTHIKNFAIRLDKLFKNINRCSYDGKKIMESMLYILETKADRNFKKGMDSEREFKNFAFHKLIKNVIKEIKFVFTDIDIEYIPETLDNCKIFYDDVKLHQIIYNIISNACKHANSRKKQVEIRVIFEKKGKFFDFLWNIYNR